LESESEAGGAAQPSAAAAADDDDYLHAAHEAQRKRVDALATPVPDDDFEIPDEDFEVPDDDFEIPDEDFDALDGEPAKPEPEPQPEPQPERREPSFAEVLALAEAQKNAPPAAPDPVFSGLLNLVDRLNSGKVTLHMAAQQQNAEAAKQIVALEPSHIKLLNDDALVPFFLAGMKGKTELLDVIHEAAIQVTKRSFFAIYI
jgi:hypothetical protein